jgi:enoyl-CoA hydratase
MEYTPIKYEKKDGIAVITLNRPDKMNAINSVMHDELTAVAEDVRSDESITVLITTGTGRAFPAGLDIKDEGGILQKAGNIMQYRQLVRAMPIPTIAAVNGFALTGGLELALSHDIIVASENATFADTHARIGHVPGITLQLLPPAIGQARARLACFTGGQITAQEAYEYGMVVKVVPPDSLMEAAMEIAGEIVKSDRQALIKEKEILNREQGF